MMRPSKRLLTALSILILSIYNCLAQPVTDTNTPLHAMQPDYVTPYKAPSIQEIEGVTDRVFQYLDQTTPAFLVDSKTGAKITDNKVIDKNTIIAAGDFRLTSYEWGVTYAGMLQLTEATGDSKYAAYTSSRFAFLAEILPAFQKLGNDADGYQNPLRQMVAPHALDDAGAMCAAMIKSQRAGFNAKLDPIINTYIDFIHTKQFRLADGSVARNRPLPNTIWLDDLFMSVPALAQMGKYSGDVKYFDDAVKQVLQFSKRMFNEEKGLYMHGWVQGMEEHPQFHWGRANGWAVMTMVELLEVLPKDHPGYNDVLQQLKKHIRGLAKYQSGEGFWHQLLDRPDSYLETSATAIYTYAIARSINRGYIDAAVYGPMVCLAWNAVSTKVNEKGQVEGTCVGTGMAFDPAFYYYRPINVYAAHGYGPVLLAGAEMITLAKNFKIGLNDSGLILEKP